MAQNITPRTAKAISTGSQKMADGIGTVGASVPVTVITKPQMLALRTTFNGAENQFNAGRKTLRDAYTAAHTAEDGLYDWLGAAKGVFVSNFGIRWSADWVAIGFVNNSNAIPPTVDDRLALAEDMVDFLELNPSYEVSSLNVTATYGQGVIDAVTAGQGDVATAEQGRDDLETARQAARTAIIGGMRGLIKNLEAKLTRNDPRWLAFGLQKPGARVTPAKPTGLSVILTGSETAQAHCDVTPLATRYRFRMRQVGPGFTYRLVASTVDPLANIAVAPGTMVEIIVQAVNDNLQSVPSDPFLLTIPAADAAVAEVAPPAAPTVAELAPLVAIQPNGNGKAKTNGNGSRAVTRLG
jgi:hypothetical protein